MGSIRPLYIIIIMIITLRSKRFSGVKVLMPRLFNLGSAESPAYLIQSP